MGFPWGYMSLTCSRQFFTTNKSESRPSIHSLVGDFIGKEADGENKHRR